jgi:hypothetical protein
MAAHFSQNPRKTDLFLGQNVYGDLCDVKATAVAAAAAAAVAAVAVAAHHSHSWEIAPEFS